MQISLVLQALLGILVFIGIGMLFSSNYRRINCFANLSSMRIQISGIVGIVA